MSPVIQGATNAPTLILSDADRNRLLDIATAALNRTPEVAALLLDEADRATVVPANERPPETVGMYSHVEYRDSENDSVQRVQLVYPHEADISLWRISVLTLVGAGLIGLTEGQSILWPTKDGRSRTLTVQRVSSAPFGTPPREDSARRTLL